MGRGRAVVSGHSAGEWAGLASAIVLVLGAIGGGVGWLAGWFERRRQSRADGLAEWEAKLIAREQGLDAQTEQRIAHLEAGSARHADEIMAVRLAFEVVAAALRAIDPGNTALNRAEQLLTVAFPLKPAVPDDMAAVLRTIETMGLARQAAARVQEGGRQDDG